ncbi:hypothetical protein NQ315_008209 [Exocentrus adspersus]|uniref:Uncharacterized protein n=1 Tax=Exocentrus adspersus TaxID=1586481 RepID=A0AAV8VMP8_9CUCU|nr:hypothetical protein NQ315_008209 [Exocentrus adspersus]
MEWKTSRSSEQTESGKRMENSSCGYGGNSGILLAKVDCDKASFCERKKACPKTFWIRSLYYYVAILYHISVGNVKKPAVTPTVTVVPSPQKQQKAALGC